MNIPELLPAVTTLVARLAVGSAAFVGKDHQHNLPHRVIKLQ